VTTEYKYLVSGESTGEPVKVKRTVGFEKGEGGVRELDPSFWEAMARNMFYINIVRATDKVRRKQLRSFN
jgi:hypothetical protein